jgi:hypothetical protein
MFSLCLIIPLISNNIGQIAYLVAQQHGLRRIYFGGCYIRGECRTTEESDVVYIWHYFNRSSCYHEHAFICDQFLVQGGDESTILAARRASGSDGSSKFHKINFTQLAGRDGISFDQAKSCCICSFSSISQCEERGIHFRIPKTLALR